MGKASKRRTASQSGTKAKRTTGRPDTKPEKRPAKKPTNLTLDAEAVARGERFGQRHGKSLSQLVTGFLYSLPADDVNDVRSQLTPIVRRLYGVGGGGTADRDAYRDHLLEKYGR